MPVSRTTTCRPACLFRRSVVVVVVQLMSFPGSDAQADAPGAEDEGGKAEEEEVAPIGSVFAVLQAYATHVFAPTVRAYAASRGGDDKVREPCSTYLDLSKKTNFLLVLRVHKLASPGVKGYEINLDECTFAPRGETLRI